MPVKCDPASVFSRIFPRGLAGIIYDCDGVMIDSRRANRHFYDMILAAANMPPMTKEQENYAFQSTVTRALARMLPDYTQENIQKLLSAAVNYDRDVLPKITLMPGFEDFMEYVHKAGIRQAIDTNRTDYGIDKVLDFFSLPQYFNPVISCTDVSPKPSSEGVTKILNSWKKEPDQVLFIGDSQDDYLAAKEGGVPFASFGNEEIKADIFIKDFSSFGKLLRHFCDLQQNAEK